MDDQAKDDPKPQFSVDTHLFRELGELLVGRDSTALIELIKNAYDADATEVVVRGVNLDDADSGYILIQDNGHGMGPEVFRSGFLRVASRLKAEGKKTSSRFGRRYTGAKGVGRLAAHKLARKIEITSVWERDDHAKERIQGHIDWDLVESVETLEMIPPDALKLETDRHQLAVKTGTTLILGPLRRRWAKTQLNRFLVEVESLRAPEILRHSLPPSLIRGGGLFESPKLVDAGEMDPGLTIVLEGDFSTGENFWDPLVQTVEWVLDIACDGETVKYRVVPAKKLAKLVPLAEVRDFEVPCRDVGVDFSFQSRILFRDLQEGSMSEKNWADRVSGVRVYVEGFRVLPYGDESDDWLSVNRDYVRRANKLQSHDEFVKLDDEWSDVKFGLRLSPNKAYVGGVFLTVDGASRLKMLVNREGFVPDASFEGLTKAVRLGIDLATRERAAAGLRSQAAADRGNVGTLAAGTKTEDSPPQREKLKATVERLEHTKESFEAITPLVPHETRAKIVEATALIDTLISTAKQTIPVNSMILILASVGTQLAAFTHEVNRLLAMSQDLEHSVQELRSLLAGSGLERRLGATTRLAEELRMSLERQASYLLDVITPNSRRRRSKHNLAQTIDSAWRFVARVAISRDILFTNNVNLDLVSPPMFQSELIACLTNLFTNAVKAAGRGGRVEASAKKLGDDKIALSISNTGESVDPSTGERWFQPFESTTTESDPVLGQGMGLGLGITRDILAEHGSVIKFVEPVTSYATTIEIIFSGATR